MNVCQNQYLICDVWLSLFLGADRDGEETFAISVNPILVANMVTATDHLGSVSVIQIGEEYFVIKVRLFLRFIDKTATFNKYLPDVNCKPRQWFLYSHASNQLLKLKAQHPSPLLIAAIQTYQIKTTNIIHLLNNNQLIATLIPLN